MTPGLVLSDARLLDGSGAAAREAEVRLEGSRVVDVGSRVSTSRATVISLGGATLLPGLIDAHVHLSQAGPGAEPAHRTAALRRARSNAEQLLASGVTTARDVGGFHGVAAQVAELVRRGELDGPELLAAGQYLCAPGGHGTENRLPGYAYEARGAAALRVGVRAQLSAGADLVKVMLNGASGDVELDVAEVASLVAEAHEAGARVACHASVAAAVAVAVAAGVDTVEHGCGASDADLRRMASDGTVLVPTLHVFERGLATDWEVRLGAAAADRMRQVYAERVADAHRTFRGAAQAGVQLAAGTDSHSEAPLISVADELSSMRACGLPTSTVLAAAGSGGAAALGLLDRGVVAPGFRADLIAVDGDPEEDLRLLTRPRLIIRAGRRVLG